MPETMRLVVVSNRLPAVLSREEDRWRIRPGMGGLVTALAPILSNRGGLWIGWPGVAADENPRGWRRAIVKAFRKSGYDMIPVSLNRRDIDAFYGGFSNQVIWPLFHDLLEACRFEPSYWYGYLEVNREFAGMVAKHVRSRDFVWVQDYQLMHAGHFLRELGVDNHSGFFLHIPFPPLDIFQRLPWRGRILRALLSYDLVGFQTLRDRHNFAACVRRLLPEAKIGGKGAVLEAHFEDRELRVGSFPIGIDFKKFADGSASNAVSDRYTSLRRQIGEQTVVLGIDRLDYTKGIPHRLQGFGTFLQHHPEWHRRVALFQVVVPSREAVPGYGGLRSEVERLVGAINGRFGTASWTPVNYQYRGLPQDELMAYYRLAQVGLVTPLKDGMNLVSKEYCACRLRNTGALVLSEFAGSAAQLAPRGALLVNPFDTEGIADCLLRALEMEPSEQQQRMQSLRSTVRRQDIFWWVNRYLRSAAGHGLEEYSREIREGP